MIETALNFLNNEGFMPHGMCILWRKDLLLLHVISDGLIAIAYFAIPAMLIYFLRMRQEYLFSWVLVMFALFITACGLTHVMGMWTIWYPDYAWFGLLKGLTAVVSIMTALMLVKVIPRVLTMPGPSQLKMANEQMEKEIEKRAMAEAAIEAQKQALQEKAEELAKVNSELVSMNDLFTGREERMVSLKAEINSLLEEMNRPLKYTLV